MQRENVLPRRRIGRRHEDDPVEATGTLHRLVDVPRGIRRRENEDVLVVGADRVELLQQLVDQRSADASGMLPPREGDRVELVEEDNARREPARLDERVVQVALADAEKRVEDLLDADVRERQAALAGGGPREQRLSPNPPPGEQHPPAPPTRVLLLDVLTPAGEDHLAV